MLFFDNDRDYEVVGVFSDKTGKKVVKKRLCHNTSRKEAKQGMHNYLVRSFADQMDYHKPIKIKTNMCNKKGRLF